MRSDTVTKPTEEMRRAMAQSEVGDDVYGEDPTVNLLQEKMARRLGKEAAMFVPSGTMSNLIAVLTHCSRRGEEVILGHYSHIAVYEQGGVAQFGGVFPRILKNQPDGTLDLDEVASTISADTQGGHCLLTRLVCIENSHNKMGGRVISPSYMDSLASIVKPHGIRIHVDGARLFNAATALGLDASELAKHADSVSICLSKGLGSPVGSVLVGSKEFIASAYNIRKAIGGGMRQIGILAAAGLISLEKMTLRLKEDHDNAKLFASGLAAMSELGVHIDTATVETNIVVFKLDRKDLSPEEFCTRLASPQGDDQCVVKIAPFGGQLVRGVTHLQVSTEDVRVTLNRIREVLKL